MSGEDPFQPQQQVNWYAIHTRSRHEKVVRDQLAHQGIEPFLPTLRRINRWKDRKKVIEFPLFPGYCFARFAWNERLSVLKATGVVRIIGFADRPVPVPEGEIGALKRLVEASLPYDHHPFLREGMRVRVIRGPLEGVEGFLVRKEKDCRVIISVNLIARSAAVSIAASDLVPA